MEIDVDDAPRKTISSPSRRAQRTDTWSCRRSSAGAPTSTKIWWRGVRRSDRQARCRKLVCTFWTTRLLRRPKALLKESAAWTLAERSLLSAPDFRMPSEHSRCVVPA